MNFMLWSFGWSRQLYYSILGPAFDDIGGTGLCLSIGIKYYNCILTSIFFVTGGTKIEGRCKWVGAQITHLKGFASGRSHY